MGGSIRPGCDNDTANELAVQGNAQEYQASQSPDTKKTKRFKPLKLEDERTFQEAVHESISSMA